MTTFDGDDPACPETPAGYRPSKPVTPLDVELTETAELLAQMPDGRIGRYGTAVGIRYLEGLLRRASERVSPETSDRLRTAEIILAQALQCDGYTEQHGEWMRQAIEFLGLRTSVKAGAEHRPAHWTCKMHGDFDAMRAVGCPECMRLAREALRQAETVMMIVEPRSHKAEYLESLDKIRAVIGRDEADDATEDSMRDSDR